MSLKKASFKSRWHKNNWATLALIASIALLLIPFSSNAKEKKGNNRLPPAPDTGAPTEDFSAGGTRDNRREIACGVDRQEIAYLLGSQNREYTSSAHPTFWFHIPSSLDKEARLKFAVKELETGKEIYDGSLERTESSIVGINLPEEEAYALSPETNYVWSLEVDCADANQSKIALSGWVTRLSLEPELQNKLATTPEAEKHKVYLEHDFLYDALCRLMRNRMTKPNDVRIEIAWNQLLSELGWRELIQAESPNKPSISLLQSF